MHYQHVFEHFKYSYQICQTQNVKFIVEMAKDKFQFKPIIFMFNKSMAFSLRMPRKHCLLKRCDRTIQYTSEKWREDTINTLAMFTADLIILIVARKQDKNL